MTSRMSYLAIAAALVTFAAPRGALAATGEPATAMTAETPVADVSAETLREDGASKGLLVGGKAPEFTLTDIDGERITLSKRLERGPVLLDFWALWCKPCLKSLPSTQAIHEEFASQGLTVLAVNTDSPRTAAKVKSYVRSSGFTFEVPTDPNGTMQRLYRFYRIPQIFLIARDGTVAFSKLGYSPGTEELLEAEVRKLLEPKED